MAAVSMSPVGVYVVVADWDVHTRAVAAVAATNGTSDAAVGRAGSKSSTKEGAY